MGQFFILGTLTLMFVSQSLISQNLLCNGDFEIINVSNGDPYFYKNNFYCKNWIEPTDCSPDIYRDSISCSDSYIKNIENEMDMCVNTVSGNYCIGFYTLDYYGYMEHITGKLRKPFQKGEVYKISFHLKFFGNDPFFSKGLGYKLSKDSVVFKSDQLFTTKLSPFYQDLFEQKKVYADFEFNEYLMDQEWTKYTTTYVAKGGEKYITFGQFCFRDDKEIIKQLDYLRKDASEEKLHNFIISGKSKYLKYFSDIQIDHDYDLGGNYYLIDKVEVVKLSDTEKSKYYSDCSNCVDLDPMTIIPPEREIVIDKGFEGDLKMELGVRLKPLEKYILEYGKNREIIIVNTGDLEEYSEMVYILKYSAKKLRKRPVRFYVEKTDLEDINRLKSKAENIEVLCEPNFKGLFFKIKN